MAFLFSLISIFKKVREVSSVELSMPMASSLSVGKLKVVITKVWENIGGTVVYASSYIPSDKINGVYI